MRNGALMSVNIRRSSENTQQVCSTLIEQGHTVWLTGVSARVLLDPSLREGTTELITSATTEQCERVLEELDSSWDRSRTVFTSLGDESLESVLRERGIALDAIAISITGEVIDPFGGVADLANHEIRTILSPEDVFREKPLTLFALARVIATTGWEPPRILNRMAYRDSGNILDVHHASVCWGQSLNTLLMGEFVRDGLEWLASARLLAFVMPEVAAMIDLPDLGGSRKLQEEGLQVYTVCSFDGE